MSVLYIGDATNCNIVHVLQFMCDRFQDFYSSIKLNLLLFRGHLKLAQQVCDELGVIASSVKGVDMELKREASLRHARTLLAAKQFSEVC